MPIRRFLVGARASARSLAAGPAAGEQAILDLLVERTGELLPPGFAVTRSEVNLRLTGPGRSAIWTPIFVMRSELPAAQRLEIVFQSYAQKLQRLLSAGLGEPWPAANSPPHTLVTDDTVSVWWGDEMPGTRSVKMRPRALHDIGM
jgi:hypothetical protein